MRILISFFLLLFTSISFGDQKINPFTQIDVSGGLPPGSTTFSALSGFTTSGPFVIYCTDCTPGSTCTGSGTGALAVKRADMSWNCGGAGGGTSPIDTIIGRCSDGKDGGSGISCASTSECAVGEYCYTSSANRSSDLFVIEDPRPADGSFQAMHIINQFDDIMFRINAYPVVSKKPAIQVWGINEGSTNAQDFMTFYRDAGGGESSTKQLRITGFGGIIGLSTFETSDQFKATSTGKGNVFTSKDGNFDTLGGNFQTFSGGLFGRRYKVWQANSRFSSGDVIISNPVNGRLYTATTSGVTGSTAPFATSAKIGGWPVMWRPSTVYSSGQRIKRVYSNTSSTSHSWRVSGNCTSGTTEPAFSACITSGCSVTDNSCTYVCDDGICSGGTNPGTRCSTVPGGECLGGGTCGGKCFENAEEVTGVTDGTVTWNDTSWQPFIEVIEANATTDNKLPRLIMRHTDNDGGLGLADAGWAGTPYIDGVNMNQQIRQDQITFGTTDKSYRAMQPGVTATGNDMPGAALFTVTRGGLAIANPVVSPTLVAVSGGIPGLVSPDPDGCWYVTYVWESSFTGGRTMPAPPASIYLDGVTNKSITITVPSPPSGSHRAIVGIGLGSHTGSTCTKEPNLYLRILAIDTNITNSATWAGTVDGEHEVLFYTNLTAQRLVEANQPGVRIVGTNTTYSVTSTSTALVRPSVRNGHKYAVYASQSSGNWSPGNDGCAVGICDVIGGGIYSPIDTTCSVSTLGTQSTCGSGNRCERCTDNGVDCRTSGSEPSWCTEPGCYTQFGTCVFKERGSDAPTILFRAADTTNSGDTPDIVQNIESALGSGNNKVLSGVGFNGEYYIGNDASAALVKMDAGGPGGIGRIKFTNALAELYAIAGTITMPNTVSIGDLLTGIATFNGPANFAEAGNFLPSLTPSCNAGEFKIWADFSLNKFRICRNGTAADL